METSFQALLKCNFFLKDVANVSQSIVLLTMAEGRKRRTKLRKVEQKLLEPFYSYCCEKYAVNLRLSRFSFTTFIARHL